ncbi:hypothetical protein [Streptomyces mangrovisoli]|nr:hypothetical protein [Streptomyces mangrovisoli]
MGSRRAAHASQPVSGTGLRAPRSPRLVAAASSARPHGLDEHQRAQTLTVSAMQRFFGIPESLVPCAVIVDLEQRHA